MSFSRNNSRFASSETYIPAGPDRFARKGGSAGVPAYDVEDEQVRSEKRHSDRAPSFNWATFVSNVKKVSSALGAQLSAASYEIEGTSLKIYPDKPFAKTFLSRDKNKQVLDECASGLKVSICDANENPNVKNDSLISKMSDIMGGEVISDAGGNPF